MVWANFISLLVFVGTLDNYVMCAVITLFLSLLVSAFKYRKLGEYERTAAKNKIMNHFWGILIMTVFWPSTWAFTTGFCFVKAYLFILDGQFSMSKIKDVWNNTKGRFRVMRDIRLTKQAMAGKAVVLDTANTNVKYNLDLEK